MKKLLVLTLMVALLSACQQSPESDIIDQKGGSNENISESDGVNGIANYEVPDNWKDSITFDNSEIKVEVDATVEIPQIEQLSTYKIDEAAGISQERVDLIINEIFGDAIIYDANKEMTKTEIEDMILRMKQQQAESTVESNENQQRDRQMNMVIREEGKDQPTVINDRSAMFDRMIEDYEERLKTAPDTVEDKVLTPSVKDTGADFVNFMGKGEVEGEGSYTINYMASEKNNLAPSLNIANSEYMLRETDDSEELNAENAPDKEEAIKQAEELINKLGLTGMVISKVSFAQQSVSGDMFSGFSENETTGKYGYIVEFSREVDGIACINGNNFGGLNISAGRTGGSGGRAITSGTSSISLGAMNMTANSFRRGSMNDAITIGITQNGIEEISWSGYFEVGDVITENTTLLSFEKIQELFKKNMELTYSVKENEDTERFFTIGNISDTFNIYKASLCLTKTAIQNDSDNSMLVPVWAFYAYQVDENGTTRYNESPVLLINAIDGSII